MAGGCQRRDRKSCYFPERAWVLCRPRGGWGWGLNARAVLDFIGGREGVEGKEETRMAPRNWRWKAGQQGHRWDEDGRGEPALLGSVSARPAGRLCAGGLTEAAGQGTPRLLTDCPAAL